jgi:hypothetical protein
MAQVKGQPNPRQGLRNRLYLGSEAIADKLHELIDDKKGSR